MPCAHTFTDGTPCAHPADGERCLFHTPPDERDASDAAVRDAFVEAVESRSPGRKRFDGAQFGVLELSSRVIDSKDNHEVRLDGADIEELRLPNASVREPVSLTGARIDRVSAPEATFERSVTLDGATLGAGPHEFTDATFQGKLLLTGCQVAGPVTFEGAAFGRKVDCTDARFEAGLDLEGCHLPSLRVSGATVEGGLQLLDAELDRLEVRNLSPDGCLVDCTRATVRSGTLAQPATGATAFDLRRATVGDVAFAFADPAAFDHYGILRTEFEGFPFADYRETLRAFGWRLHGFTARERESSTADLELTYLKAKNGATAVGDNDDASQFFVREMRYRRRRYRDRLADASLPLDRRFDSGGRWLTNRLLGLLAGYGERPSRVLGLALAVLTFFTAAYAAFGVTAGLSESIYFSIVTFTTLGYGDIVPPTDVTRLLAATEAICGAFLTALFVFTLGRRVTR
ncbi:potassium channel family protein [Natronomonas sp. EA1]|uniref:potassium channel family protein n=1 Tax=Natronomonas sp. EA1 TaxID=3421655 RepID=UPI003EBAB40D